MNRPFFLPTLVLTACLISSIATADHPTHVYAYNRRTDGFDTSAEGMIWSDLGLLDDKGKPGTERRELSVVRANGFNLLIPKDLPISERIPGNR